MLFLKDCSTCKGSGEILRPIFSNEKAKINDRGEVEYPPFQTGIGVCPACGGKGKVLTPYASSGNSGGWYPYGKNGKNGKK